jgi:hypothetical protein
MLTYDEYAALSKTPHALADGLMLVFQHPVTRERLESMGHRGWSFLPFALFSMHFAVTEPRTAQPG